MALEEEAAEDPGSFRPRQSSGCAAACTLFFVFVLELYTNYSTGNKEQRSADSQWCTFVAPLTVLLAVFMKNFGRISPKHLRMFRKCLILLNPESTNSGERLF